MPQTQDNTEEVVIIIIDLTDLSQLWLYSYKIMPMRAGVGSWGPWRDQSRGGRGVLCREGYVTDCKNCEIC